MAFDSHVHIFPYLGGANGYPSVDDHLRDCQRLMQLIMAEPTYRSRDNSVVTERKLWSSDDPSLDGWLDRNFAVGKFGRFTWEQDGHECYLQFMPPGLQDMQSPPHLLLAMMARAGVTRAVVQCGSIYGRLNRFHEDWLKADPSLRDVLFPLVQVYEDRATHPDQIAEFRRAVTEGGLRGLWYTCSAPGALERENDIFWRVVEESGVPVFFDFYPSWEQGVLRMGVWRERFPTIPVILPQSFPTGLSQHPASLTISSQLSSILESDRTWVELAFPIARGGVEEYPFAESAQSIRAIYETLGGQRLVWGSDAPNVERYVTYKQSLDYLTKHCDFISNEDKIRITESNLAGAFSVG